MLPAPNLDDRGFQNLVDDARRLVRHRFPEWSDHNISDPGITLIEAVAHMVDQLIYRLNRVPERNYLEFLDLLGLEMRPASSARTRVTFWLSASQSQTVTVRAATEVSTDRTDIAEPVVFSTDRALDVVPCSSEQVCSAPAGADVIDRTLSLGHGGFDCFSSSPTPDDALLIGLSNPVPSCAVLLRISCRVSGVGVDPRRPPLRWEALTDRGWVDCDLDRDDTGGFNEPGDVIVHVPEDHSNAVIAGHRAGWLRCRLLEPLPDQPTYSRSPHIDSISASTIGGTVPAAHSRAVSGEILGVSDGTAAQRFTLQQQPVVPDARPGVLTVTDGTQTTEWHAVDDFADAGDDDLVFHLDAVSGEVVFGPAIRNADGTVRGFGAIPRKGAVLGLREYRIGGGTRGNVGTGQLRVLKTSVPYITRVENRSAAVGGAAAETVEELKLRGPVMLRSRGRAVTAEDFEELTREAAPEIARVHCLTSDTAAGEVRVLVVPHVASDDLGQVRIDDLKPLPETMDRIAEYLDRRRLIGTRLLLEPPQYIGLTAVISVSALAGFDKRVVQQDLLRALYRMLHPLVGGHAGTGWPVGRPVGVPEISATLASVPGVDMGGEVSVQLFPVGPSTGRRGQPTDRLQLPPNGLVHSHQHQARVL